MSGIEIKCERVYAQLVTDAVKPLIWTDSWQKQKLIFYERWLENERKRIERESLERITRIKSRIRETDC